MQFTKLRLQGFKSFVDPTDLTISTGLTGVVGPNGCGKSNLLEALRWAMGENRAKSMRGDGMEDVIFAGAESRPARNTASVDIVIDNTDRRAPAAFNESDRLEVSRRITRDIGSAYTLNGKNVRARDIQMLFADASTGAHSPALVRQGQIVELISAKPKARRRILEEAAGISGLYQRRHEAELKLGGAETNLARVEDVLEGLDAQLKSLERQAAQARRYREIADNLRRSEAALLFLRWKTAKDGALVSETEFSNAVNQAAKAEGEVLRSTGIRSEAEDALPPLREEEMIASAAHQRLVIEGEQLDEAETRARREHEALHAGIRQMRLDLDRETTLNSDADRSIDQLASEERELRMVHDNQPDAILSAQERARTCGELLSAHETELDRLTETAARLAARTASAERRKEEAETSILRIERDVASSEEAIAEISEQISKLESAVVTAKETETLCKSEAEQAEVTLATSETMRSEAQATEAEARALLSEAEGRFSAIAAEVDALDKLLKRDALETSQLIDAITVAPGYEAALGAALGDDLRLGETSDGTGWTMLPATGEDPVAATLSDHVDAPRVLSRRLRKIGLVMTREEGDRGQSALRPGERLVTKDGDLWRWDGVRIRAEDASSGAAHRLRQRNQLSSQRAALSQAEDLKDQAAKNYTAANNASQVASRQERERRDQRRIADQAFAEAARLLTRYEGEFELARGRREAQTLAVQSRLEERDLAAETLIEARAAIDDLDDIGKARQAVEEQRGEVDLARTSMLAARAEADDLRRQGLAREKRLSEISREQAGWTDRRDNASARISELETRVADAEALMGEAEARPDEIAETKRTIAERISEAETRRKTAADQLTVGETNLRAAEQQARDAERDASVRREERARCETLLDVSRNKVEEAASAIQSELDMDPDALLELVGLDPEDLPLPEKAETEVQRLRRQRDSLGAVNLRADEDAEDIRQERDGLASEKEDLESAIAKLRRGIGELNREGRQRILEAFEQVNEKFSGLFRHLFGGGEARLVMVDSDDPLDAGLEILCQPPGKKLSTLSLLSGGEQTLTAMSLIFAVFLSNPAPICVLDEVDAPLDDANVTRFCDLLDEMVRRTNTRFLIITHHAITMSRMDRLFGVTMVERGVSQLVSVDLAKAAEMVDG